MASAVTAESSDRTVPADTTVRVLQSALRPSRLTNPYITQAVASLPEQVQVEWFSWRTALLGRYDVVHAHWPEFTMRSRGRVPIPVQRAAFALWLLRLYAFDIPVVRTAHNVAPHDSGPRTERLLLRLFDARTVTWIALNDHTTRPGRGRVVTIPLGHYIDWYAEYPVPASRPKRLVFFGLVRPYKGVDELLAAFTRLRDADASLAIVGRPEDPDSREIVERAVAADGRISARLEYVADADLVSEVGAAQLVVLPYRGMLNSSAVLVALSLHRPVLIPGNPINTDLAEEVGREWVLTYEPPLTDAQLADALAATAATSLPTNGPQLVTRDWPALGRAHHREYVLAARQRKPLPARLRQLLRLRKYSR